MVLVPSDGEKLMAWTFSEDSSADFIQAERDVRERVGGDTIDFAAMGVISNVYRVASAMRNHMEREVLANYELSFTAFVVMFVLWVWGDSESYKVASRAGITKGTLTGVVKTLEKRDLCSRVAHDFDKRRVIVALTPQGVATIEKIFPLYNYEETRLVAKLEESERLAMGHSLRTVLRTALELKPPKK